MLTTENLLFLGHFHFVTETRRLSRTGRNSLFILYTYFSARQRHYSEKFISFYKKAHGLIHRQYSLKRKKLIHHPLERKVELDGTRGLDFVEFNLVAEGLFVDLGDGSKAHDAVENAVAHGKFRDRGLFHEA